MRHEAHREKGTVGENDFVRNDSAREVVRVGNDGDGFRLHQGIRATRVIVSEESTSSAAISK